MNDRPSGTSIRVSPQAIDRRRFCTQAASGLAATGVLANTALARQNGKLVAAVIGCGGQGKAHIVALKSLPDIELKYVCDADETRRAAAADLAGAKPLSDLRKILDDRRVDVVTIATPDHWHAPAALLALAAGKHVYVEKPCAHNLREARMLVESARRNKRLVQHGTQSRSNPFIMEAIAALRGGIIGDVLLAKAWNVQVRKSIGRERPSAPPRELDYDTWLGPAPFVAYQSNRGHYNWHWWYDFGTGDMGNDGVHDIDYARWGLGVETQPSLIAGVGGKYAYDDDQQFPDTQTVAFQYDADDKVKHPRQLIFEMRLWSNNYPFNADSGAEFHGAKGVMHLTKRGKVLVLGDRNQKKELKLPENRGGVAAHMQNLFAAIRGEGKLNAPIDAGLLSASLCHLGNLSTRLGRSLKLDPKTETVQGDAEADKLLGRTYRSEHWGAPLRPKRRNRPPRERR